MFLILMPAAVLLLLVYFFRKGKSGGLVISLNKSVLIFSAAVLYSTELFNYFDAINIYFIRSFWVTLVLSGYLFLRWKKISLPGSVQFISQKLKGEWHILHKYLKYFTVAGLILVLLVFFQGLIYPPNNYDTMTYHLARIPHWLFHGNVEHYRTDIYRQLYQPPFSGYALLHIAALCGSDFYFNALQTFFLVLTGLSVYLLTGNNGTEGKIITFLLTITLPAAILQASGSTNNIIEGFFILSSIVYVIRYLKKFQTEDALYAGLAGGLAAMTKGTSYIYLAPLVLLFLTGLIYRIYKTGSYKSLITTFVAVVVFFSLTGSFYQRNIRLSGHFLGIDKKESQKYANENNQVNSILSNVLKNASLHAGPFPVNKPVESCVRKIHEFLNLSPDDDKLNFDGFPYTIPDSPNYEDCAPNPVHAIMMMLIPFFAFARRKSFLNDERKLYGVLISIILIQFILFSAYLKWQPWHSRNHIPLFFEAIVLLSAMTVKQSKKFVFTLLIILLFYAFMMVLFHKTRPYIPLQPLTFDTSPSDQRFEKYFTDKKSVYEDFKRINDAIILSGYETVGLDLNWNEYEYPLFTDLGKTRPVCLFPKDNPSALIKTPEVNVGCIVSNRIYLGEIEFESSLFRRMEGSWKEAALYIPVTEN